MITEIKPNSKHYCAIEKWRQSLTKTLSLCYRTSQVDNEKIERKITNETMEISRVLSHAEQIRFIGQQSNWFLVRRVATPQVAPPRRSVVTPPGGGGGNTRPDYPPFGCR